MPDGDPLMQIDWNKTPLIPAIAQDSESNEVLMLAYMNEEAYNLTHPDGKTILVGVPKKGDNVSIYTLPLHFKKVLTGSHGGDADPHVEIPRFIRLMKSKRMSLDGIITHEFGLNDINEAIALVRSGKSGRVIISMDETGA